MLVNGIKLYTEAGDTASADICLKELEALPKVFFSQKDRLSEYGKMIEQQPRFYFPMSLADEMEKYGVVF